MFGKRVGDRFDISMAVSAMPTRICWGGVSVFVFFSYFPPMFDALCLTQFAPRYHVIVSCADGQLFPPKTRDLRGVWRVNFIFSDYCAVTVHFAILLGN